MKKVGRGRGRSQRNMTRRISSEGEIKIHNKTPQKLRDMRDSSEREKRRKSMEVIWTRDELPEIKTKKSSVPKMNNYIRRKKTALGVDDPTAEREGDRQEAQSVRKKQKIIWEFWRIERALVFRARRGAKIHKNRWKAKMSCEYQTNPQKGMREKRRGEITSAL